LAEGTTRASKEFHFASGGSISFYEHQDANDSLCTDQEPAFESLKKYGSPRGVMLLFVEQNMITADGDVTIEGVEWKSHQHGDNDEFQYLSTGLSQQELYTKVKLEWETRDIEVLRQHNTIQNMKRFVDREGLGMFAFNRRYAELRSEDSRLEPLRDGLYAHVRGCWEGQNSPEGTKQPMTPTRNGNTAVLVDSPIADAPDSPVPVDRSDAAERKTELAVHGLRHLQNLAKRYGIKKPGVGWPKCCPPTGDKADIIEALLKHEAGEATLSQWRDTSVNIACLEEKSVQLADSSIAEPHEERIMHEVVGTMHRYSQAVQSVTSMQEEVAAAQIASRQAARARRDRMARQASAQKETQKHQPPNSFKSAALVVVASGRMLRALQECESIDMDVESVADSSGDDEFDDVNGNDYGGKHSVKLLEIVTDRNAEPRDKIRLAEEGRAMLNGEDEYLNTVMIFGALGLGKSHLMNELAGEHVFKVSAGIDSCTQGIDISRRLLSHPFAADAPKLAFVDFEGKGDGKGESYFLKLAVPMVLTSKIVIMNVRSGGRPSKDDLTQLQILIKAAEKTSKKGTNKRNKIFGHLHLVMRDCRENADREAWRSKLLDPEDPDDDDLGDDEERLCRDRNETRANLLKYFHSVDVWCLPHAVEKPQSFARSFSEMRDVINEQTQSPMEFNSKPLTGRMIAAVVQDLAETLNSPGCKANNFINPPEMMDRIYSQLAQTAERDAASEASANFKRLRSKMEEWTVEMLADDAVLTDAVETVEMRVLRKAEKDLQELPEPMRVEVCDRITNMIQVEGGRCREHVQQLQAQIELAKARATELAKERAEVAERDLIAEWDEAISLEQLREDGALDSIAESRPYTALELAQLIVDGRSLLDVFSESVDDCLADEKSRFMESHHDDLHAAAIEAALSALNSKLDDWLQQRLSTVQAEQIRQLEEQDQIEAEKKRARDEIEAKKLELEQLRMKEEAERQQRFKQEEEERQQRIKQEEEERQRRIRREEEERQQRIRREEEQQRERERRAERERQEEWAWAARQREVFSQSSYGYPSSDEDSAPSYSSYGSGGGGGGPRCKDGSLDMRYAANRGRSKYG
jgi:hypothetical protein